MNENIWNELQIVKKLDGNKKRFRYYSMMQGIWQTVELTDAQYSDLLSDWKSFSDNIKKKFEFIFSNYVIMLLSFNC